MVKIPMKHRGSLLQQRYSLSRNRQIASISKVGNRGLRKLPFRERNHPSCITDLIFPRISSTAALWRSWERMRVPFRSRTTPFSLNRTYHLVLWGWRKHTGERERERERAEIKIFLYKKNNNNKNHREFRINLIFLIFTKILFFKTGNKNE